MKHTFETVFELSDRVYYKLPNSPEGLVTGIGYSLATNLVTYYVTFDPLISEASCFSWELSKERVVI